MSKKLISGIAILVVAATVLSVWLYKGKQTVLLSIVPTPATAITPAPSSVVSDDIADWKTYNSKNYGFEVKYSKNYSAIEKDDMPTSYITIFNTGATEFKAVKTEELDEVTFIDSQDADAYKNDETHNGDGHFKTIDIATYNNGNNHTLEQWFKKNTEVTSFEAGFTSQKEITVGGVKGTEGIYGCCMAYKTTVFLKNNNKIYKISGNYLEGDPSVIPVSNEKMYNQMLSAFKFTK